MQEVWRGGGGGGGGDQFIGLLILKQQIVRLICDTSEKRKILHACHCDPTSGHLGIKEQFRG